MLDAQHLAIADLGGNNRIDSLRNIVETGHVGMLFIAPGRSETVRVNGEAWVTTDPDAARRVHPGAPADRPRSSVRVTATFIHCAKAFRRSGMWDPGRVGGGGDGPDAADILVCQSILPETVTAEMVRADLEAGLRRSAGVGGRPRLTADGSIPSDVVAGIDRPVAGSREDSGHLRLEATIERVEEVLGGQPRRVLGDQQREVLGHLARLDRLDADLLERLGERDDLGRAVHLAAVAAGPASRRRSTRSGSSTSCCPSGARGSGG